MRIAIIHPRISYYHGGGEKFPLRFILELTKDNNIIVDLYTIRSDIEPSLLFSRFKEKINSQVNLYEISVPDRFRYLYQMREIQDHAFHCTTESIFFNSMVYPIIEQNNPDIIWCNYVVDCLVKPLQTPSVVYLISGFPQECLYVRKAWVSQYNEVISISKNVQQQWNNLINEESQHNYLLYPVPVLDEEAGFKGKVFSKEYFNILFAGRLIKRKGVQTLMMAINRLGRIKKNIYLNIFGQGPHEDHLRALAKELNLNVNFFGFKSDINNYYRNADICVFPSYRGEGLMGVVLEAMACGAFVITTSNNGNEEIIDNNINGIIVESENVELLADALLFAYSNPQKIKDMGGKAKEKIENNFTWDKHIKDFIAIATKVINRSKHMRNSRIRRSQNN